MRNGYFPLFYVALAGAIAAGFGFASIFLFAALAAFAGLLLSLYLYRQAPKYRDDRNAG